MRVLALAARARIGACWAFLASGWVIGLAGFFCFFEVFVKLVPRVFGPRPGLLPGQTGVNNLIKPKSAHKTYKKSAQLNKTIAK